MIILFFFLNSDSACLKFANEIKVQNGTSQDVRQKTSPLQALDLLAAPTPSLINYQLDKAHHSADKGTQFLTSSLCEVLAHQKTGNVCTIYMSTPPELFTAEVKKVRYAENEAAFMQQAAHRSERSFRYISHSLFMLVCITILHQLLFFLILYKLKQNHSLSQIKFP